MAKARKILRAEPLEPERLIESMMVCMSTSTQIPLERNPMFIQRI